MPISLIDKIKPKNGGSFPMVDAEDVQMPDGTRLSGMITIQTTTEAEYTAMVEAGTVEKNVLYAFLEEAEGT